MVCASNFPAPRSDEGQFYWRFDQIACNYLIFERGSRFSFVAGKWARVAEALSRLMSSFPQHRDAIAAGFATKPLSLAPSVAAETSAWRAINLAGFDPFAHGFDAAGHPRIQTRAARAAA